MVASMSFGLPKRRAPRGLGSQLARGEAVREEPDWARVSGIVPVALGDREEVLEVDPEFGPRVYTSTGDSTFFHLGNLNCSKMSVLEMPQKQWKDFTASERKVACYMAAKRNQSLRAWAVQESVADVLKRQEAAKQEEEAMIKELENRCEGERKRAAVLWRPVSLDDVLTKHSKKSPGMFYGLEFPWTSQMLEDFGPKWLTQAFQRAGSLEATNRVVEVKVENIQVTGGNNAGKFLFRVRYAKEREGLHTKLFAKVPHQLTKETKQDRLSSSVLKQPMDFCEINTYRLSETRLPTKTPKFYYGDISNDTTNYILITERVPYVGTDRRGPLKPYEVEGPYDKCKDYQLKGGAKEYYTLIMQVSGQIAGADKTGKMGSEEFLQKNFTTPRPPGDWTAWGVDPVGPSGGPPQGTTAKLTQAIRFFSETAAVFFPSYAKTPEFIDKFTNIMMTFMAYTNEIDFWKHEDVDYIALSHANLNVDNAYYWRDEAGKLCCGVLDWGGFGRSCLGHKVWWYLNCSEFEPLQENLKHFCKSFADSYRQTGGPALDVDTLERMVRLTSLGNLSYMVSAVPDCLRQIPAQDWASIKDRYDPRIDGNLGGKSTLRTTLRVMDNGLRMIQEAGTDADLQWFIDEIWVKRYGQTPKSRAAIFGE